MKIIERSNRVPIPRVITLRGTEPILDPPPPLSPFICFHQKRKENVFTPKIGSIFLLVILHQVKKSKCVLIYLLQRHTCLELASGLKSFDLMMMKPQDEGDDDDVDGRLLCDMIKNKSNKEIEWKAWAWPHFDGMLPDLITSHHHHHHYSQFRR